MRLLRATLAIGLLALAAGASFPSAAQAETDDRLFIGVDGRTLPFTGYPDNPNYGRLTLLYAHGDHYHGLGAYRYVGPTGAPVLEDTNANNRLPEISSAIAPLPLSLGSGAYAGKLHSKASSYPYSDLELRNVGELEAVDPVIFNSSAGRWSVPLDGADIHLKLLSVSSPWLRVGSLTDPLALPVGSDVHLGEGDDFFSFTPVLWTDAGAPVGNYWAEFQLVDEAGVFGNSGRFFVDVRVPEPTSWALAAAGSAAVGLALGKRRWSAARNAR